MRDSWIRNLAEQLYPPEPDPETLRLEHSFRAFIEPAWQVIEPATPFVDGYHVDAIADHLQAITDGYLKNLIINIPPRHSKSTLVSVLWQPWEWIRRPDLRYVCFSYTQHLSLRDNVKARALIESGWYQRAWSERYALTDDQNQKMHYRTNKGGFRLASSVSGVGTGEGGERLLIDDPNHALDAERAGGSTRARADEKVELENVRLWWDSAMPSRGNNPATTARVIVQQRIAMSDLTGHVLELAEQGGEPFELLALPAEYEPRVQVCLADLPDWHEPLAHDPRTEAGQELSPDRYPASELRKIEVTLGALRYAGQYQQRPVPAAGAIFLRAWYDQDSHLYSLDEHLAQPLKIAGRFISWDTAYKVGQENDLTAWAVFDLMTDLSARLRHIEQERLRYDELLACMWRVYERWNYDGKIKEFWIEDKASGISAGQTLSAAADQRIARILRMVPVRDAKNVRAKQAANWCRMGAVKLPRPHESIDWWLDFAGPEPHGRLFKFPALQHDDDIDAFDQGIIQLEPYFERWKQALEAAMVRAARLNDGQLRGGYAA